MNQTVARVQEVSGVPVLVREDRSLKMLATVRMARGDAQAHIVTYNPTKAPRPDYVIAFQCGFIIRTFSNPPEQRFDFAPSASGRETVERLLEEVRGKLKLPAHVLQQLRDQLFDGLMVQLRSVPIGLRIDAQIHREYRELADLQRDAVLRQLQENQQSLAADVRKIAPTNIFRASVTMNAAFAAFWARTFDDLSLTIPYRSAGFSQAGADLLGLFDEIPDEPADDRALIDAWADKLNLSDWYQWIPYGSGVAAGA